MYIVHSPELPCLNWEIKSSLHYLLDLDPEKKFRIHNTAWKYEQYPSEKNLLSLMGLFYWYFTTKVNYRFWIVTGTILYYYCNTVNRIVYSVGNPCNAGDRGLCRAWYYILIRTVNTYYFFFPIQTKVFVFPSPPVQNVGGTSKLIFH